MTVQELRLRKKLGIPEDASKVLIFGESTHWDPNWMMTSKEYYYMNVQFVISAILRQLKKDLRRVYTFECVFYVKMFWDRHPEQRNLIRSLVNEGRLCFSGTGFTTADTVLPEAEALIRDYLYGQEWLRSNGMNAEPRIAYFPDNFGMSPSTPTILHSLGIDYTSMCRIDGHFFPGSDYGGPKGYPLFGSSAELLLKELKTLDFVWSGPDGAEVLCHFNPKTYGHADMIAYAGLVRWMGITVGIPMRTDTHIKKRIDSYVADLESLSRTPYMFCPIGFDFNLPVFNLVPLLDRYNERHFRSTGIYVVNASMECYMDLVNEHRSRLPALQLDCTPYWMGFYSSRPEMKQRCNRLVKTLIIAEKALLKTGRDQENAESLKKSWGAAVIANHHDYITGTSPNRVWRREQRPWLVQAQSRVDGMIGEIRAPAGKRAKSGRNAIPDYTLEHGHLVARTKHYTITMDEGQGGCITSLIDAREKELVTGCANDLIVYEDWGGLWRLGNEYMGGRFRQVTRASILPARLEVTERHDCLEVSAFSNLDGRTFTRIVRLSYDSPVLLMSAHGRARSHRTVTCGFPLALHSDHMIMDVPGAVVRRPQAKLYTPTFWAAKSFVFIPDTTLNRGAALFMGGPASPSFHDGVLECVVAKNTRKEIAFGFLPVLAHPAAGADAGFQYTQYAICFVRSSDWRRSGIPGLAARTLAMLQLSPSERSASEVADSLVSVNDGEVAVMAAKKADRGEGIIVRLYTPLEGKRKNIRLRIPGRKITRAFLCDARERDLATIPVRSGMAAFEMNRNIITVRLY